VGGQLRDIELLRTMIEQDGPSEHELAFMRALFTTPRVTLAQAYHEVFPQAGEGTARVNGSRMLARIMRKGWVQFAFEEAGLTAGYTISKIKEVLEACDIVPIQLRDGRIDYTETPNWRARSWALQMLGRLHGLFLETTSAEQSDKRETFAERVRAQRLLLEQSGNGKLPPEGESP
jgi:hypothetical protein